MTRQHHDATQRYAPDAVARVTRMGPRGPLIIPHPCADPDRHGWWCPHSGHVLRWRADDGCSGAVCWACYMAVVATWGDVVRRSPITAAGLPLEGPAGAALLARAEALVVQADKDGAFWKRAG